MGTWHSLCTWQGTKWTLEICYMFHKAINSLIVQQRPWHIHSINTLEPNLVWLKHSQYRVEGVLRNNSHTQSAQAKVNMIVDKAKSTISTFHEYDPLHSKIIEKLPLVRKKLTKVVHYRFLFLKVAHLWNYIIVK